MKKTLWTCALALSAGWLFPAVSSAQVTEGDLRLALDTSLFSFNANRVSGSVAGRDVVTKDNVTTFGPGVGGPGFGGGGLAVGYAVASGYLIPTLRFGLARLGSTQRTDVDGDQSGPEQRTSATQLELNPLLEVAFLPDSSFVPFGAVGFSYVHQFAKTEVETQNGRTTSTDSDVPGFGPTLGLGFHAFASERASFDMGLTYRALFLKDDDTEDSLEAMGFRDVALREHMLALTLGASFWL